MIKKFLQKIFKIVSYTIFIKIYGKIENSIISSDDDRIKVNVVEKERNLKYNIYKINKGRLYTDRIHDTAILLDNKILKEPSFQFRYNKNREIYNSKIENNIVFTKGTPRRLRNLKGSVLSLLTGGGGNNNYWHWLFDVLPRFNLCSKFFNLNEIDFFLLPNLKKNFQKETLNYLNISNKKILSSEKFRHIKTDELIITDHPVMTSGDATKDIMDVPIWISEWLKESFLKQSKKINNKNIKKIYIDRSEKSTSRSVQRLISNEKQVKEYLLKNNFVSIKLHEINFMEQVNLFYNAESIVGLHGGGFANIVFCKPGTKILELRSHNSGKPIENLAKKNNLNYNSITVKSEQIEKFDSPNQQGSIEIPINSLIKELEI